MPNPSHPRARDDEIGGRIGARIEGRIEGRLAFLDGLRAIAAGLVMAQHYLEHVAPGTFGPILALGPGVAGVVLFFCLSGYVIPLSVRGAIAPLPFLLRRVMRIWPLYLCVVTALILLGRAGVAPFDARLAGLTPLEIAANYALVFEYTGAPAILGVAWTLPVEAAWYLTFLLVFMIWGHARVVAAALVVSALLALLAIGAILADQRLPLGRVGMIGACFIGYVYCRWHLGALSGRAVGLVTLAFAGAMTGALWVGFGYFSHPLVSFGSALSGWLTGLAGFVAVAVIGRLRGHRLWGGAVPRTLGRVSFSLYLLHMPVLQLLTQVVEGALLMLCATLATLALSVVSFHLVERPAITLGRRILRPAGQGKGQAW
ncbi:acyltransferase family protein [Pseudooceanicola sp.]|uniref:acyltransferase family protein n=1 Tax=Pseudooceanicola sp. TaxID=1914328 RepID=UPI0035C71AB2